jgi:hypothetical protein
VDSIEREMRVRGFKTPVSPGNWPFPRMGHSLETPHGDAARAPLNAPRRRWTSKSAAEEE